MSSSPRTMRFLLVAITTSLLFSQAAGPTEAADTTEVLNIESTWRSHVSFRPPVVGTARKVLADKRAPANWRLAGGDFSSALPPKNWTEAAFDDSQWARGEGPFFGGYGNHRPAGVALACLRGQFNVNEPSKTGGLKLSLAYRGGVVVYLNGKEVARKDIRRGKLEPLTLADDYPQSAFVTPDGEALLPNYGGAKPPKDVADRFESRIREATIDVPAGTLRRGTNVLAIELHRTPIPADLPPFGRGVWDTTGLLAATLTAPAGSAIFDNTTSPGRIHIFQATPWERIDPEPKSGNAADDIGKLIFTAPRNGICSGQIVVGSAQQLRGLSASVTDLKSASGRPIPARAIQVRYAGLGSPFVPLLDRPVDGAKVQPVWLTVNVPADAAAGKYHGAIAIKAPGRSVNVPIELTVHGWRVGDPKDWKTVVNLLQSPESVACHYGVPLWSDRHFKLIEKSFGLMAISGNDVLGVSAVGKSVFGDDPLIVFRKKGDRYVPEFKFLDRYLESYDKIAGQPRFLSLNIWSHGMYRSGQTRDGGKVEWRNTVIPVVEIKGDKLIGVEIPIYGPGRSEALWKAVMDGLHQRVERLGWHDLQILLGTSGDAWPSPITVAMFKRIAPYAQWRALTHGCGVPKWGTTDHERTQPNGMVVGYLEIARRLQNHRVKLDAHPVPCNARDNVGTKAFTYRSLAVTNTIVTNYDGFCWKGVDYWTYATPDGTKRNALNTYVHFGNMVGGTPKAMAMPGPDGAVSTVQFEMLREGVQECEAILAIRDGLNTLYPQQAKTYDCMDLTLDGALVQQKSGTSGNGSRGKRKALEVKMLFDHEELVAEIIPNAPTFNTGKRTGTIKRVGNAGELKFEIRVNITDDKWVKGGQGTYAVQLKRDGHICTGNFDGTWQGVRRKGSITGVFSPGGHVKAIGEPRPKTELANRCDAAIEAVCRLFASTTAHGGGEVHNAASRLYSVATEVAGAVEAQQEPPATEN